MYLNYIFYNDNVVTLKSKIGYFGLFLLFSRNFSGIVKVSALPENRGFVVLSKFVKLFRLFFFFKFGSCSAGKLFLHLNLFLYHSYMKQIVVVYSLTVLFFVMQLLTIVKLRLGLHLHTTSN